MGGRRSTACRWTRSWPSSRPFHPAWTDADPELIALCDREAAHGNFRAWAKITHHLTVGMKETGRACVDEELLRWAYSKLSHRRAA
ncbi:hypothetical protein GCM10010415_65190 [Streptomyces atrovirens]|uniref:Uncharacterized protein n=1 Tax=Streptomyces atrovirens TaxID=285556 RepID=A0ABW0DQF4_9ACTN